MKFKVGDVVKIINPERLWRGCVGKIEEINEHEKFSYLVFKIWL